MTLNDMKILEVGTTESASDIVVRERQNRIDLKTVYF